MVWPEFSGEGVRLGAPLHHYSDMIEGCADIQRAASNVLHPKEQPPKRGETRPVEFIRCPDPNGVTFCLAPTWWTAFFVIVPEILREQSKGTAGQTRQAA